MINSISEAIKNSVEQIADKIDAIAKKSLPERMKQLAKDVFDTSGAIDGRNWSPNTASTTKRKGFNKPNVEHGDLYEHLTQTDALMQDDFMMSLPTPKRNNQDGYFMANRLRKFDDIGRTLEDEKILKKGVIQDIKDNLS